MGGGGADNVALKKLLEQAGQNARLQPNGAFGKLINDATVATRAAETDALSLVTSAIDLSGELRGAEVKLKNLEALGATGLASDEEREQARIRIDTLARKLKAVHLLLDAERQATEAELANAIEQRGKTEKGTREAAEIDARIFRLEARVKTLQLGR
jgi:hypothetical protein